MQKFLAARLLFLIENTGVRKFHIHPEPPEPSPTHTSSVSPGPVPSLLVWVFTPDLLFSSSIQENKRSDPTRAMKIFYERKTWAPLKAGEVEESSVEDVEFPAPLYEELDRVLRDSRMVLPESARRFQGWDVGLLERFDVGKMVDKTEAEPEAGVKMEVRSRGDIEAE
jgi:hypothetical protein